MSPAVRVVSSYTATDLPLPFENFDRGIVVLYAEDPAFVTAVEASSEGWALRVKCWRATGKPYGVVIEGSPFEHYERERAERSTAQRAVEAAGAQP